MPPDAAPDSGLGLEGFLAGPAAPLDEGAEKKPDDAAGGDADEKKPDDAAGDDAETKGDDEKKPPADAGDDADADDDDEKKPAAARSWDDDENPWKAKAAALEKQQKATRDYSTQTAQQLADLKRANERLEKKLDGTWDEATEKQAEIDRVTRDANNPATIATQARVNASIAAARETFGDEKVTRLLTGDTNEFDKLTADEKALIFAAEAPAFTAIKIIERKAWEAENGTTPAEIEKSLRAKWEKGLEPLLEKMIAKRLKGKDKTTSAPVGAARSAATGDGLNGSKGGDKPKSLEEMFDTFR